MIRIPLMSSDEIQEQCNAAPAEPNPNGWMKSVLHMAKYCECHEDLIKDRIRRGEIFTIGNGLSTVSNTAWLASPTHAIKKGTSTMTTQISATKYYTENNLEELPSSLIPKFLGCTLKELGSPVDHYCLLGRNGKGVEFHFEPYRTAYNNELWIKMVEKVESLGLKIHKDNRLCWHNPGRTDKLIINRKDN